MASTRSIHRRNRKGKYNGPQQALARHDATRVRFVVRTRYVRAWRGGRARRPSRSEEGSDLDGDRCALCPVRGGGRAQDLREIRARDELQAVRRRQRRAGRAAHRQFGYRRDHRARRAVALGQGRQALRHLVLVHQREADRPCRTRRHQEARGPDRQDGRLSARDRRASLFRALREEIQSAGGQDQSED